jgi:hypothetical protein
MGRKIGLKEFLFVVMSFEIQLQNLGVLLVTSHRSVEIQGIFTFIWLKRISDFVFRGANQSNFRGTIGPSPTSLT